MRILILGAGNLLLSDEGFGVHFIRYLEQRFVFPEEVRLLDAGTGGLMVSHQVEEAERVYIVDTVNADGPPGTWRRYDKDQFALNRWPVKLSPHQVGLQEMLLVSQLRGRCPEHVTLFGIIPESLAAGTELSAKLAQRLPELAQELVAELRRTGVEVRERERCRARPAGQTIPCCPLCGRAMTLRTAKAGKHTGSQFWGCTGFPGCKGTRAV
jgi:hydrogenase maturation protease